VLLTESTFLFLFLPIFIVLHVAVTGVTTADWMHGHVPLKALNLLLVAGSVVYFALLDPVLALILLGATVFTYGIGAAIVRTAARRLWLGVGLAGVLGLFALVRYGNAVGPNVGVVSLPLNGRPANPWGLTAVVISFFALPAIAHLVETYRKPSLADLDPVRTILSLLFFPFLLAGPIVRRKEMAEQMTRRVVSVANFAYGMRRFAIGLFKKVAIADTVGLTADTIFNLPPTQVAVARAWLGLLCFGLQIYFAVSAYSDMALGLGRMFGFRLSENFKWPYVSRSLHEFWEKWFSSLGDWMREYLRLPLGSGHFAPMSAAFLLAGLWYGTRWTFIVWVAYHAAFVALERIGLAKLLRVLPVAVGYAYALLVVTVGWVFFRADSLPAAGEYLRALVGLNRPIASAYYLSRFLTPEVWLAILSGIIGAAPLVRAIGRWRVAIDGATTAIAVMAFAVLVYIWRMGVRVVTVPMKPHPPSA
jgi:alginate O-acetyltransferase complex protein AlgI